MIKQNQPTIFDSSVVVAVSSVSDGTMKFGVNKDKAALANRIKFLQANEISIGQSTPLSITYDRTDYADYRIVTAIDEGKGMRQVESMPVADALVTLRPEHALFLTLADCCGVVLHDPIRQTLMLSL